MVVVNDLRKRGAVIRGGPQGPPASTPPSTHLDG